MDHIESSLFVDPQQCKERRCQICGGCVYPPGFACIRCQRDAP